MFESFYFSSKFMFQRKNGRSKKKLNLICPNNSGVFIVNFKHISYIVQVYLLLALSR